MEYRYINPEYLESVSGGDPEIVKEIVGMFREQTAEAYRDMLLLLDKGDYNNLGLLAHKVKSSVAIMGMNDLAAMLKTFELQGRAGKETASYRSYIERFREETEAALTELDYVIKNLH